MSKSTVPTAMSSAQLILADSYLIARTLPRAAAFIHTRFVRAAPAHSSSEIWKIIAGSIAVL